MNHGVKQIHLLASILSASILTAVLKTIDEAQMKGIFLRTRSDGGIYNPRRLQANTEVRQSCLIKIMFVDGTALHAVQKAHMQVNKRANQTSA